MLVARALPAQLPDYFPPEVGRYEVKPGLIRFGKELGGGEADGHVFQLDPTFPRYRAGKLAARAERLAKYFQVYRLAPEVERAVADFILGRLVLEHPEGFALDGGALACNLTGDKLRFRRQLDVQEAESVSSPLYVSALDALAMQVQEDLAVVSMDDTSHWLSAVHLCFPNHWAAEAKIGRTFAGMHDPVAGMEQMNRRGDELVRVMIDATDGLVRFAWGVTFDDELNHHPQPALGTRRSTVFDPRRPAAFLRVERQTIRGFPHVGAALFTIRTYLYDITTIRRRPDRRRQLAAAIASMSDASLAYKGLASSRDALLHWLEKDASS